MNSFRAILGLQYTSTHSGFQLLLEPFSITYLAKLNSLLKQFFVEHVSEQTRYMRARYTNRRRKDFEDRPEPCLNVLGKNHNSKAHMHWSSADCKLSKTLQGQGKKNAWLVRFPR